MTVPLGKGTRQAHVALCSAPDQLEELPTGRFQRNPTGMNSTIEDTGWKDFGCGWDMRSSRHPWGIQVEISCQGLNLGVCIPEAWAGI